MLYADLRLRGVRTAVVMVDSVQLHNEKLIDRLQRQFAVPVMLVARDETAVKAVVRPGR